MNVLSIVLMLSVLSMPGVVVAGPAESSVDEGVGAGIARYGYPSERDDATIMTAQAPGRNLIMGTGEQREPQMYTREQRLLEAARQGDRATVERALELGVPVDSVDDLSRSALLLAARDARDLGLVRFLHQQGGAIDRADAGGRTPLSWSSEAGRLDLVKYFVDQGAKVDPADRRGRTPLFHAVLGDQLRIVSYLVGKGARVNVADRFQDTPLMMACSKGYEKMARALLGFGADPSARDQEGRRASDRAAPGFEICRTDGSA